MLLNEVLGGVQYLVRYVVPLLYEQVAKRIANILDYRRKNNDFKQKRNMGTKKMNSYKTIKDIYATRNVLLNLAKILHEKKYSKRETIHENNR